MIGEYQLSTGEKCTLLTSDGLNENLKAQVPEKKPKPAINLTKLHNFQTSFTSGGFES